MVACLCAALVLVGCGPAPQTTVAHVPEPIAPGEECHVCGMIIAGFPGPKAEAYVRGVDHPLKFCSTRDLFAFLLQPETPAIVQQVFVHDMGATDWDHPGDTHFTDARTAWYVVDQPRPGAMGPTLASFRNRAQADAFVARYGGRVLRYDQIDLGVMESLTRMDIDVRHPAPDHSAP
jgi:copper chaperone NosL